MRSGGAGAECLHLMSYHNTCSLNTRAAMHLVLQLGAAAGGMVTVPVVYVSGGEVVGVTGAEGLQRSQ